MHLAILTDELATSGNSSGGLASFSANLARIFRRNGHRVTIVLVTTKKQDVVFDEGIVLKSVYVEKAMWNKLAHMAQHIAALIGEEEDTIRKILVGLYKGELVRKLIQQIHARERIDIIHTCNLEQFALGLDDSIPYVVRISSYMRVALNASSPESREEYYDESTFTLKDQLDIYLLQKARYVISPSNLLAEMGREKMGIAPVVIESPFVLDRVNWDDSVYCSMIKGKKYIIHYGRLSYFKGTHILVEIVKRILEKHPDIYMLLAGADEGLLDDNGQQIMAHELIEKAAGRYADRVVYAGCLVREQLYPLIENAEICLLPYRLDNLSNACIEAMAMGRIVIGTDGASFEQLIDDRQSGFLCRRDDPESYLEAVEEVLSMSETAKRQMESEAARQVRRLAPEVIYRQYYDFYQKVISEW